MKNRKFVKAGILAAMTAVPFHAHALSTEDGLDACADAMVDELAADQGAPMIYNLDPKANGSSKRMSRQEIFHLDARDPQSQEVVARYDCVINGNAQVQKLIKVPLDAPDARFRATGLD